MTPVSQRPAGDYASGDDTLNIAPSKLIAINEQLASLVPEWRFDVQGSFCLRDGITLTGAPGNPPQVRDSIAGSARIADLGDASTGGNDGAVYQFLFLRGSGAFVDKPCFMHCYLTGGGPAGSEVPVNIRVLLRAMAACKSVADIKAVITKYNPAQNVTDIETRWPWVKKAVDAAVASELAAIQSVTGGLDSPAVTGLPFQIFGSTRPDLNNSLKGSISIQGGPTRQLNVIPDNPPTVWDGNNNITAEVQAQGVDTNALYAAMQQAAG